MIMLLKILLKFSILICITSQNTNDSNLTNSQSPDNTVNNGLSDVVKTASLALSDPRLAAAIEIIKNLKTESSTSIGEVHDAKAGFYEFDTSFEIASGVILPKNIDKLMNLWLTNSFFDTIPSLYRSILSDSIKEIALQMEETDYMKQKFSIHFQDGRGVIHMMVIMLEYDPILRGTRWTKQILIGGFVPSRDWVIVTRTKSNMFKSKTTTEIVYLPPIMSLGHIQSYMEINKQMILSFYKQFSTSMTTLQQ